MNKFLNVAIVGGAALAVGVLPAASSAYAAVAPTPPPITTVTAPPSNPVPGNHGTPGAGQPGRHRTSGSHGHGSRGRGTSGHGSRGHGSGTGDQGNTGRGSGSHSKGSTGRGSRGHGSTGRGSHRTTSHGHGSRSHGTSSHGHGSTGRGTSGHGGHRKPVQQPSKPSAPAKPVRSKPAPTPLIIGGTEATNAPWAAQISWDGVGFQCSGTVVAPQWVLTAGHCANKGGMSVRVGSTKLDGGDQINIDAEQIDPNADLALLHLATPTKVRSVKLATTDPKVGAVNEIYGWGMTAPDSGPAEALKVAKVRVRALDCVDAVQGPAICSTGINGHAYNGDSGGPEMSAGQEVGVCSTGEARTGGQQYASIAANRGWIRQVANV